MKLKALLLPLLIPLILSSHTAYAASAAVQQMAEVLLNMDRSPSETQRATLQQIADGTNVTENEQKLAKAMLNINGTLSSDAKQLVWGTLRSINASEGERELAKLINRFDNQLSEADLKRLSKLLPPKPKTESEKQ